jgi:coproporphyrinogen III oxidase-like Fe-S oxidoreductase
MLASLIRSRLRGALLEEQEVVFRRRIPQLGERLQDIDELGVYLHIPFCDQICPYCPYNRELYQEDAARRYARAVKVEIDRYGELLGNRPVTSFYIGGGTPTTMIYTGLGDILEHAFKRFDIRCDVHMESHPNHLDADRLGAIAAMGVNKISIGVESLQDRHLKTLSRTYTVAEVKAAVERTVSRDFKCVNADVIFALPGQTYAEVEQTGRALVAMGLDQVAAYPLFVFPYTPMARAGKAIKYRTSGVFRRRKMLGILEQHFYGAGFRRTSAWAFTRPGVPKYCSVTVPLYVGLGASGSTYLKDVFYLNTFRVAEYVRAIEAGRMPIALSVALSERMQMAGWLYWRIYATQFRKSEFRDRFGREYDDIFGKYTTLLSRLGLLKSGNDRVVLSDSGTYWLHALEDLFSINYINKLWGVMKREPWPEEVVL